MARLFRLPALEYAAQAVLEVGFPLALSSLLLEPRALMLQTTTTFAVHELSRVPREELAKMLAISLHLLFLLSRVFAPDGNYERARFSQPQPEQYIDKLLQRVFAARSKPQPQPRANESLVLVEGNAPVFREREAKRPQEVKAQQKKKESPKQQERKHEQPKPQPKKPRYLVGEVIRTEGNMVRNTFQLEIQFPRFS